jgi:16S rRNA (cytosine1402-N4)-methyltransferase
VLLREAIRFLDLQPGLTVVDGTVGAGGHGWKILEQITPLGTLIGLDRDPMMIRLAALSLVVPNCSLHQASYVSLPEILEQLDIPTVDRVLLDLGLSSDQLADDERGFRFESAGPLDLRFDSTCGNPAWKLIEQLDEKSLADLFSKWGEERFSGRIARRLVKRRRTGPVRTAADLVNAVAEAIPQKFRKRARKHPATRVFQALRIAVNDELRHLEIFLRDTLRRCLSRGGRAVVISFHSLEDRLVKAEFRDDKRWQNLTAKPVTPTAVEQKMNPRSRSAKLRAAIKI